MAEIVTELYNNVPDAATWYANGILEKYRGIENTVFHKWNDCLNQFKPKTSNTNTAKICNFGTVKLRDYIDSLERKVICIDDIRSVLTNKHKFIVLYTDNDTYLTKDPTFEPVEEETALDLFQGI